MEGGPSQIGMNHNSRGIDDSTKPGLNLKLDPPLDHGIEVLKRKDGVFDFGRVFDQELFTELSQSLPDSFHHHRPGMDFQEIGYLWP
jgi:hypothetical protein